MPLPATEQRASRATGTHQERLYFKRKQSEIEDLLSSLVAGCVDSLADDPLQCMHEQLQRARERAQPQRDAAPAGSNVAPPPQLQTDDERQVDDEWSASAWLASLNLTAVVAETLGWDRRTDLLTLRRLGAESEAALVARLRDGALADRMGALLHTSLSQLSSGAAVSGSALHSKFVQECGEHSFDLVYGDVRSFFDGLEARIGAPDPKIYQAMEREHTKELDSCESFTASNYQIRTTPKIEWWFVTEPTRQVEWPTEVRSAHPRKPLPLQGDDGESMTKRLEVVNDTLDELGTPP